MRGSWWKLCVWLLCFCTLSLSANTYLVSVGIADYSTYPSKINNLRLTVKDAQTMVNLYANNRAMDYTLLVNEKATKTRILKAIKKLFNMASENDIAIFFFSGHGYAGGFCACDGNVTYKEVREAMAGSKCKNKIMFVDACRSGGIREDEGRMQTAVASAKSANVMLFLSSRNNENSIEKRSMQNGFFTTYLKLGLAGEADVNRDRVITAREIFTYVSKGVANLSEGRQHPVMWGNFSDNMPVMQW
jgi:uncharacterized caspase-like protein